MKILEVDVLLLPIVDYINYTTNILLPPTSRGGVHISVQLTLALVT